MIVFGDALAHMKSMANASIDLIVTDPPYKVISGGIEHSKRRGQFQMFANSGKIFRYNEITISEYLPEFYRLLKPGSHCYVMTNNLNLRELLNVGNDVGFGFHNLLIWEKNNANANRWYMKHIELTVLFYKKPAKPINNCGSKQIFKFDNPRDKSHPTEKPVELMQHYIENSSSPNDIILDPFCGTGSTIIAATKSNRRAIGIECDDIYALKAVERLQSERVK